MTNFTNAQLATQLRMLAEVAEPEEATTMQDAADRLSPSPVVARMTNSHNSVDTLRLLAQCGSMDLSALGPIADEMEKLQGEAEVADEQLAQLRGFAEAHKTCVGLDELASVKACWAEALANVATRNREIERLQEVLTFPIITPEASSSALFIRVLSEHEKGQPVNGQDLINALMWRVRNQKREIARLHATIGGES